MPAAAAPTIKVPSLAKLTTPPPAGATPPAADPKPGEGAPPAPTEPPIVTPPANEPPAIPTDILAKPETAPITTPKGAEQFKQERLQKKEERQSAQEIQIQFDQTKAALQQEQLAREKLEKDLEERRKEIEKQNKILQDRTKDLEDLRTGYFEQHRAQWNPLEDEQFQQANAALLERLKGRLPIRVPTQFDDQGKVVNESRVFFDAILQQNGAHQGLANMLDAYAIAKRHGNEKGLNTAVNAMAQFLGANVDMTDADEKNWRLLPPSSDAFKAIELALDEAVPFHVQRAERYAQVQKEGPVLARQQFENRETSIRQTLASRIFLAPDVAAKRLEANNEDTTALMGILMSQAPALKEIAERKLAELAPAYAAMGDKLFLPGLASNNPAEIAAHRAKEAQTRQVISEAMEYAVVGACMGPVLSSLIAERDAAEERANAASLLTNPGGESGARAGKGGGGAPQPAIETEIVTGR